MNTLTFAFRSLLLLCSVLGLLSCHTDGPVGVTPGTLPDGATGSPVLGSINITHNSPDVIAVWQPSVGDAFYQQSDVSDPGKPVYPGFRVIAPGSGSSSVPRDFDAHFPYDNPAKDSITLAISLPRVSVVQIWIYRAVLSGGAHDMAVPIVTLSDSLPAGYHTFRWYGRDAAGYRIQSGPFRYYVQMDGKIYKRDFVLYRETVELPQGLQAIVNRW